MRINYSKDIDEKWNSIWKTTDLYKFTYRPAQKKVYLMEMFSYPSGSRLHVGHWWNFGLSDVWGRKKRMEGYNVFHPMGFDAFGLPAENYAIKTGIHPKDSTEQNIKTMEEQLSKIGATYDWNYEIKTCDPDYYKWTQWLFLQMFQKGLAYRREAPVNWCPQCKTVLANEQAMGGICERCGSPIIQKNLTQWFFKITDYADELLEGLDTLDWPEKTKNIQRNWIGKSEGIEVTFQVENFDYDIMVFTTRIDTLMGVTYLVLAPEHPFIQKITDKTYVEDINTYCESSKLLTELERTSSNKEKTGVFTGAYAIHPITGKKVPIWIGNYVVTGYGSGAVMAVPAHDTRDFAFAKKYKLPIQIVINSDENDIEKPNCKKGILINSGIFDSLSSDEGAEAITNTLIKMKRGRRKTQYRLRDWLISRQRYWGTPIPVIYCENCGVVPVPEKDLPVELPYDVTFTPDGKSPLEHCKEFVNTTCPCCKKPARRETDTLDTFVCSSWYYLRYGDPKNKEKPWDWDKIKNLMPVDKYVGGIEHAAMHLLYARFIYKALRDMNFVKGSEPFLSLVHQGIILGPDGQKMSKSLGNTISPDDYVKEYGSDVFRTYLAFGFSYLEGGPWNDNGIKAVKSFFNRICRMYDNYLDSKKRDVRIPDNNMEIMRNRTIQAVSKDIDKYQFNTAIARLMEFRSAITAYQKQENRNYLYEKDLLLDFIKLLAPFAPHFSEEIWFQMGEKGSIFNAVWPQYDSSKLTGKEIEIAVQINNKTKSRIWITDDMTEDEIKNAALRCKEIRLEIAHMQVKKIVCIKNRLINIVI